MKSYAALIIFICVSAVSYAQSGAYIIPRTIFVGDRSVLIVPLAAAAENSDTVLNALSPDFPLHENIDFHRIILEQRTAGNTVGGRLIVEFTAFIPGLLELPIIRIGEESFYGLTVKVNSTVDMSSPVLSAPASLLSMPGTAIMIYGTMAAVILFILFTVWFILKGRILIKKLRDKFRRWILFISMKNTEKNLQKSVLKGEDNRLVLDKLSEEFRTFLSILTGSNCRPMTAHEFEKLPLSLPEHENFSSSFLRVFFGKCDELRFSGDNIDSHDILCLLADLRGFLVAAENTGIKNITQSGEKAA